MAIGEPIWGSLFFTVWAVLPQWRLGKTQALFVDNRFKIYWLPYSLPYSLPVWWPWVPEPARHPRAVCGPGPARWPARCVAPCVPSQEVAAPPPGAPAFPAGLASFSEAVLVAECGGSRHPDRGGTGRNISRSAPEPLQLKGPMGEAATRAASLLANSQHLCHSKSGYKLSQIQPTTQSPQNPRALRIHLPADPETPDKPSVHIAIFQEDLSS